MSFAGRGRGFGGGGGAGRGSFGVSNPSTNGGGAFSGFGSASVSAAVEDDAWDDTPTTKGTSNNGFGTSNGGFGSSNNGFGGGGGFESSTDGFGASGDGFGSSNAGFGSSNSGFGSGSAGFGSGSKGSGCHKCGEEGHFARECPTGGSGGGGRGGGGRGGGGSRACHKCGEEGHFARECPTGGSGGGRGGGGSRACHKCGEEGHFSRECPTGGSGGGGGGSRACHKCGEEGHFARECPTGGSGGGGGGRACYKCGKDGHISRDCPGGSNGASAGFGNVNSGGGFGSSGGGGSSSGGFGDSSGGFGASSGGFGASSGGFGASSGPTDGGFGGSSGFGGDSNADEGFGAKSGGGGGGGSGGGSGCRNCGQDGHFARECPEPRKPQGACRTCNQEGHFSKDCPQNEGKPPPENYIPPDVEESEDAMFKSVQVGINFDKYDEIPVELTGNNATRPIHSFAEAGLMETVETNVKKAKYFKPTPIQKYAIPAVMAGRDLMGCAQTGSGKTAAFLLPVLTRMVQKGLETGAFSAIQEPQALVVAPTRELVIQIYNECKKFSYGTIVRCVRLYGGTSTMHQANDLSKGANIVIATPGRLLDFVGRQKLGLGKIQFFILDEADRMLDMGFEPDIRRLVETMGMPAKTERQTLMFSATFPTEIQKLAGEFLNEYLFLTVGVVGGANQDVTQSVLDVPQFEKREKLLEILREHPNQRTLVFVEQKRNADFLASMLSQSEFATTSIHGDRLQREREQALLDFKSGAAPVLVATSVAARGLDIPGVDHVINYDLPKEIDEYVHRIGRTGRCGNLGRATSFYDSENNADLARHLVRCLSAAHQIVPDFLEKAADSGGVGGGGRFGGRDNRSGKGRGGGGGDMGGWDEQPSGMAPAAIAAEDDESWD